MTEKRLLSKAVETLLCREECEDSASTPATYLDILAILSA